MDSGARVRAEAAKVLDAVVADGRSLDWALAASDARVPPQDKSMLRMLCYGCLRQHWQLRAYLDERLDRPLKKRDRIIGSLITIGLFQLNDTRVPDHAAVSTTVDAARLLKRPKLAGLVNAILRNFRRSQGEGQEAPGNKATDDEATDDQVRFNHPTWLIQRLRADWPDHWQQILAANNDRAPMWLRVNARHATAAGYQAQHALAGTLLPGVEQALRLDAPAAVEELPGFSDGHVSVQDGAAQLAAPWLLAHDERRSPADECRVLDACAAPGGKTGHLLELLGDEADLTAIDADAQRLAGIRENLARLKLNATVLAADASKSGEWWDGKPFDRILLDAPCSASGVIRRHPDIKLLRRESDVKALAGLQRRILDSLWPLLRPGGRLLYVTCSVLAAENDAVVGAFLSDHADAQEDRVLHAYNIHDLMIPKTSGFQVLPGEQGLDGFYFACLTRDVESRR